MSALLSTLTVFGQGTVNFVNSANSRLTDPTAGNVHVAGAFGIVAALYWAPLSDPNNFTQIGSPTPVGVGQPPGIYRGGVRTTGAQTPPGAAAWFQVVAWEVAYGATFEVAVNAPNMNGRPAKRGCSNIILVTTGGPTDPANLTSFGLSGFAVFAGCPEPSTVVLYAVGVGALLLVCRR